MDENSHPNNEPEPASAASSGGLESNPEVEEFFQRLVEKQEMRRPKPNDEAIAAALQAIQRLTNPEGGAALGDEELPLESAQVPGMLTCSQCGYVNQVGNQFCGMCGGRFSETQSAPIQSTPAHSNSGQHHYHHHDHHHYFHGAAEGGLLEAALGQRTPVASTAGKEAVRLRAPAGGASLSKAEATVRQLTQDWAVACNNKQLDDILTFYGTDALVLRPNVPPVRGTAAIREFFFSALEAGLGDVEMETLRVELYGDVAYETGRCKMLVPVAMGKRREERGKYVIVFAKQKTGEWQAIVDSWSSDLNLAVASEPAGKASTAQPVPPKIRR